MPILSNSVVTRPLSEDELLACCLHTRLSMTDTRMLRFYYRRLPDNRLQIGTRSAITGLGADKPKHYHLLLQGLYDKFPALKNVAIDYSWWGWVDVSHDMMPRVAMPMRSIHYALDYGGTGVSFSFQAGRRIAQRIVGVIAPVFSQLPIYTSELPKATVAPLRRLGLRLAYRYYQITDNLPL